MIRRTLAILMLMLIAISASGCQWSRGIIGGRGTIQQQRAVAAEYDPYPDPELGPEIVGGRPRDFDQPRSEVRRSRWWENTWWSY